MIAAVFLSGLACGQEPELSARKAVERTLEFLEKDALRWKEDPRPKKGGCATCHHGSLTIWALSEAKFQGYEVHENNLAELAAWTKERFIPASDQSPNTVKGHLGAAYLAMMARALPRQEVVSRDELTRISEYFARSQEADGSWYFPPLAVARPPLFESREEVALLCYLALGSPDPKTAPARDKATAWLGKTKPGDTTQAAVLRLFVRLRPDRPSTELQPEIDQVMARQNGDGGWSQLKGLSSDAYATGQALYALGVAGADRDRPEIQRAVSFLVAAQRPDGTWPMMPRAHPGGKPNKINAPLDYLGSAWATLGLLRSIPPPRSAENR
ncbi:MAG TPA: hypothetical protein VF950_14640 [Planctomycetota bacterium]